MSIQKISNSRTPLSWAAENGCVAVVKLLLATGKTEVDSKDNNGRTPLRWAVENGHIAVIQVLLATERPERARKTTSTRRRCRRLLEKGSRQSSNYYSLQRRPK